ncbi:MAG: ABC transporter substrate-binding protein [Pseudomonadota bacterium]
MKPLVARLSRRSLLAAAALGATAPQIMASRRTASRTVRIAATPTAVLVWLADAAGFFQKTGFDVQVTRYTSGTLTAPAMIAGDADLATRSEYAFITAAFSAPELRVIASISQSRTVSLFGNAERGLTEPDKLGGRVLAVVGDSFGEFLLERFLLSEGADPAQVVRLRPPEIVQAALEGAVDGGVVWDPYLRQISIELGDDFVELSDPAQHEYHFLLHGTADWLAQNREAAQAVLQGLRVASHMAEQEPEAAKRLLAKRLDLDLAIVDYLWPKHTLKLGMSQALLRLMEDEAWFRIERGLSVGQVPNFLQRLYPAPLLAVEPEAVSVIGLR